MSGVLYGLLSRIDYSEIAVLFERLEVTFKSIVENVALDLPENAMDDDTLAIIEKQAQEWDHQIAQHPANEKYVEQAKGIYYAMMNLYNDSPESNFRLPDMPDNDELLKPLTLWFGRLERPYSYVMLLYYHQRIKQLRNLLELYQVGANNDMLTSRHLFEKGLLLLHAKEEDYLKVVFDLQESSRYGSTISFLTSLKGFWGGTPRIDWVTERTKRQQLIDVLNRHLKYAALAYRDHKMKVKGIVKDELEPYEVHFTKYGGNNIKGRFHLQGNMNGYVGCREDKTIVIGLSGTELTSKENWKTDFRQYFGKMDPVYLQAAGLVHAVWMGKRHKKGFKKSQVVVCGHSLGGGLMQYAVSLCQKNDMLGYGYNSAGLSEANMFQLWNERPKNIFHLHLRVDVVFVLPFAYQLGKSVNSNKMALGPVRAHLICVMRRNAGKYRHEFAKLKGEK